MLLWCGWSFTVSHGYHYIPLLLSGLDIPVRLGGLLQWIASIYDGLELSRLDETPQEDELLDRSAGWLYHHRLAASP